MLFLLLFVISVVLVASWFAYSVAFYSPKRKHATADDLLTGPQYDPVSDHIFTKGICYDQKKRYTRRYLRPCGGRRCRRFCCHRVDPRVKA